MRVCVLCARASSTPRSCTQLRTHAYMHVRVCVCAGRPFTAPLSYNCTFWSKEMQPPGGLFVSKCVNKSTCKYTNMRIHLNTRCRKESSLQDGPCRKESSLQDSHQKVKRLIKIVKIRFTVCKYRVAKMHRHHNKTCQKVWFVKISDGIFAMSSVSLRI